ncbi:MAG TPA: hemolysin III family protein [Thermoanaerobaculales bacterium]|nr:hemolysin III family protein [Thermoanaerobaculales bacterium]HQN95997.1 hemolysin III family protein [Thermoanaerobaculales bacterium]HQP42719.1 hemolysin III family protein [Thermoanaerobaculales bacterium]
MAGRPAHPRRGEEIASAVTHGLGAAASVAGLAVLVTAAALRGDAWHVVSVSIFGATLVLLYAASTLYHGLPLGRAKAVFRVLDHSAIYLLIAGTYTPFALVSLRGPWGWSLFGVIWGCAVAGIVLRTTFGVRWRVALVVLYVAMGWAGVVAVRPMIAAMPAPGIALVATGGLAYTSGIAFYGWRRLPYHHAVWHLFVLAGSALHFLAVLLYVVPRGT